MAEKRIAILGSSGGNLFNIDVRGTAYVPSVVAPTLSNNPWGFVLAPANRLPRRRAVKGV